MAAHPATDGRRQDRPGFLLDLITGTETELDSLQRLTEAAAKAVNGPAGPGPECAAVMVRGGSAPLTAGSSTAAAGLAASEDRYGDGPLMQSLSTAGAVTVDGDSSVRWRPYRRRLVDAGYGGAVAVPLGLDGGTSCALVFLGRTGTGIPDGLLAEAKWFAGVATHSMRLALEVRSVRSAGDNLKSVLESRTSIDVACGVIMAQNRCTYPEAFIKLASASRQRNLKVRSVAENILKGLPSGAPAARFES